MSKEEKRKTVGTLSIELTQKEPDTRDPIALEREAHREYEENVIECVQKGVSIYDGDFFVVVLTKKERLMQNVLRHYYLNRQSCPTPEHDQTVYRYDHNDHELHFLWTVPDPQTCEILYENKYRVDPSEWELLQNVLKFYDGSLMKQAKIFNGEKLESPELAI